MVKRTRRSSRRTGVRQAAALGRLGMVVATRLQRASAAALQPWLQALEQSTTERRDKWVHDHTMPRGQGRWVRGVAVTGGGMRQFQLYLPPGQRAGQPLPLMVMLHGCHQDAASFAHSTRMHRLADREQFAVLFPQQDRRANAQGCWNWFDQRSGRALQEARIVLAAIDQACLLHGVDRTRVALAGLSAGASLAALLAQQHGGRFRAVVLHSGVAPGAASDARGALAAMQARPRARAGAHSVAQAAGIDAVHATLAATAAPAGGGSLAQRAMPWPPALVIHGDRDTVVSPRNALDAVAQWVAHGGGVARPPTTRQRGQRLATEVAQWRRRGDDVVTLVMVNGLGHGWSGGPASLPYGDPSGPDASLLALRFAQRQWRGDTA